MTDRFAYLRVINISNPTNPIEVGAYETLGENSIDIAVSNGFAYVADWSVGLYTIDISNTANPKEVGLYRMAGAHDTAISARTLASPNLKIPGKYFQTVRCFRPDVIDASHNVDFFQTGGFVIGEGINFQHLKKLLRMFAEEFCGTSEIKIVPAYFPFTEPSAELFVKHPELGWIELAGAGIFRPELVKPLVGKDIPVIAWGVGLDRVAMINMGINDIRKLFSKDLNYLKNQKVV